MELTKFVILLGLLILPCLLIKLSGTLETVCTPENEHQVEVITLMNSCEGTGNIVIDGVVKQTNRFLDYTIRWLSSWLDGVEDWVERIYIQVTNSVYKREQTFVERIYSVFEWWKKDDTGNLRLMDRPSRVYRALVSCIDPGRSAGSVITVWTPTCLGVAISKLLTLLFSPAPALLALLVFLLHVCLVEALKKRDQMGYIIHQNRPFGKWRYKL